MSNLNSKEAILERSVPYIRHNRKCIFTMHVHLVFVTKYRRHVLNQKMLNRLSEVFREVCHKFESSLTTFNGEDDYVHLTINYPPKVTVSTLVNSLKGVSSRYLQKEFSNGIKLWKGSLWSPSYFAGTCKEGVRTYIVNQREN